MHEGGRWAKSVLNESELTMLIYKHKNIGILDT